MAYQTKQQQAVLHCLRARAEECISAAELSEDLRHEGLTVGLATVYRQLDRLTAGACTQGHHRGGGAVPILPAGRVPP